jgi:hypothetical protein
VASANTAYVKKTCFFGYFLCTAKKVTRSLKASESFGFPRQENQRQGAGFQLSLE